MSDSYMFTSHRNLSPMTRSPSMSSVTSAGGGGGGSMSPTTVGTQTAAGGSTPNGIGTPGGSGGGVSPYVYGALVAAPVAVGIFTLGRFMMQRPATAGGGGGGAVNIGSPIGPSPASPAAPGRGKGQKPRGKSAGGGGGVQSTLGPNDPAVSGSKFKKGKKLGQGAFGAVYLGCHRETGEIVAIKEMDAEGADELKVEFDLLSDLHHAHVVSIKAFEILGKKARLYLEWVANGSLSDMVVKFGSLEEARLQSYARQMLLGLAFLHDNGILHRDIKPKNILVDHEGRLKLTDFGLSRHLNSMNPTTRPCGTPVYMAPECLKGQFTVGSDLWAVGASLVELASGNLPWSHLDRDAIDNNYALMYHIGQLAGQRGHHPLIPHDLSAEGKDFILKCFAPFPQDRGTCHQLLEHPWIRDVSSPTVGSPGSVTATDSALGTAGLATGSMRTGTATTATCGENCEEDITTLGSNSLATGAGTGRSEGNSTATGGNGDRNSTRTFQSSNSNRTGGGAGSSSSGERVITQPVFDSEDEEEARRDAEQLERHASRHSDDDDEEEGEEGNGARPSPEVTTGSSLASYPPPTAP